MKRFFALLWSTLPIIIFATTGALAQDRMITRSEFLTFMKWSEEATKTAPYRKTITFETGQTQEGPWKPYSSMVDEVITPDRSRLTYTSGPPREFVRIGKSMYSKESNGSWTLAKEEAQGWRVSPASEPMFRGPVIEYWIAEVKGESQETVIKVVSKPEATAVRPETEILFYTYFFDQNGQLSRATSISFNGKNWVKCTENIEYDLDIRIEAPIK